MPRTAVVAGVGPDLGESLVRKFHDEGCEVAFLARSADYLDRLEADLGERALGVAADLTDPGDVERAFDAVRDAFGGVDVLVNHASGAGWNGLADTSLEEFEHAWRVAARGGFLCTKHALPDLRDDGGTVVFTGATSAVRGRDGALAFSSAKFAVRGMAESLARELGPEGVHVAHVVVDGQILPDSGPRGGRGTETYLDPDEIAENYWHLVEQDRSAWTLELDLRPHVEEF